MSSPLRKRKHSVSEGQHPHKSMKSEPLPLVQDVVMASGRVVSDPPVSPQPSQEAPTSTGMKKSPSSTSSTSPINLGEEDLVVLELLLTKRFKEDVEDKHFGYMITGVREHFWNHKPLASKLGIDLTNLETTSAAFVATQTDKTELNTLFEAASKAVVDPKVETWKAFFSHPQMYKNHFKYPDGEHMNSEDERDARSRHPGEYPTEKCPYIWLKGYKAGKVYFSLNNPSNPSLSHRHLGMSMEL
ncbi:3102_t:CDS:2 [Acaulospora colombiana]|uniref:3102_t:CDS:1 n=1 Tax=Acaulospora colombiana TaxID=27376 RepID=A0ACA9N2I5_9GLOM|nr:3102_t:CDS:2 [Acaulospora colombiana]